jgi:hypothetical protein
MNKCYKYFPLVASSMVLAAAQVDSVDIKFSDFAQQNWLVGNKAELREFAETRLSKNPRDLASLMILFDYGISFSDIVLLDDIMPKIKAVSAGINTVEFSKEKELLAADITVTENLIPSLTEKMIESEKYKGNIKNKPLSTINIINALETDGLVRPLDKNELNLVSGLRMKIDVRTSNDPSSSRVATAQATRSIAGSQPAVEIALADKVSSRKFSIFAGLAAFSILALVVARFVSK